MKHEIDWSKPIEINRGGNSRASWEPCRFLGDIDDPKTGRTKIVAYRGFSGNGREYVTSVKPNGRRCGLNQFIRNVPPEPVVYERFLPVLLPFNGDKNPVGGPLHLDRKSAEGWAEQFRGRPYKIVHIREEF